MQFTEKEFDLIKDVDFILTKVLILDKVNALLSNVREEVSRVMEQNDYNLPEGINLNPGKISKGENYQSLPYQVLDYPAIFDHENIFAIRTMFWWGHHFSCTLHLQGKYLNLYRESIWENRGKLFNRDFFISVGDTPWQYHYDVNNYLPYVKEREQLLRDGSFLKLSQKFYLRDYHTLPVDVRRFMELMCSLL